MIFFFQQNLVNAISLEKRGSWHGGIVCIGLVFQKCFGNTLKQLFADGLHTYAVPEEVGLIAQKMSFHERSVRTFLDTDLSHIEVAGEQQPKSWFSELSELFTCCNQDRSDPLFVCYCCPHSWCCSTTPIPLSTPLSRRPTTIDWSAHEPGAT